MGDLNDDLREMAERSKREPPRVEIVTDGVVRIPEIGAEIVMRNGEPLMYARDGSLVFPRDNPNVTGYYQSPHMPHPAMDIRVDKASVYLAGQEPVGFFTPEQRQEIRNEKYRLTQEKLAAEMAKLRAPELDEKFMERVDRLVEEARRQGKEEGWNEGRAAERAYQSIRAEMGEQKPLDLEERMMRNPYLPPIDDGDELGPFVLDQYGMPVPPVHVYDYLDNCVQCGKGHVGPETTKYDTRCPGAIRYQPLDGTRPTDDDDDL